MARKAAERPHRDWRRWALAIVLVLGGLYAWTQLSPWPSAMAIRAVFDIGGRNVAAKLEPHVPTSGLVEHRDLQYDAQDRDAKLDLFLPAGNPTRTTIVWIHGGGYVAGSKSDVANYARILASKGYGVASIEYARAPEAHYPTPIEQANRALAWVSTNAPRFGIARDRIVLAGDSAGAQIAAQLANVIVVPAYARTLDLQPAIEPKRLIGAVLFCGPFDAALTKPTDGGKPSWFIRTVMWSYTGRKDFWNLPGIAGFSVTPNVTKDFPPTFVSVGNGDPLQAHSYALADALRAQGVRVDALFWPEDRQPALAHEYQFDLDAPAGQEAFRRMEQFLASLQ